jgi:malate dehydrogenase (oxaloacetate-decarboxylating)(NADP+)
MPDLARQARPDAIIATGRSDFPNQVNNVLCFPFIFRGALDVGATTINEAMKLAAVRAIADLAMAEQSDIVATAYGVQDLRFGPDYLIPKPFDPRLIVNIAPAVAKAAMDSGVATRPIPDFALYREKLTQFVYHSGLLMKPIFTAAKEAPKRVVYAEGESERVLRAVQVVVDEGLAHPILVGRPEVIARRIERYGLRLKQGVDFEAINPDHDERYREYWQAYHRLTERKGITQEYAKLEMRRRHTLIGAMTVHLGHADGMLCGTFGMYELHRQYIEQVIGLRRGVRTFAAMNALVMEARTVFLTDTYVNIDPSAEQLVDIAMLAADEIRRFGITPKVAFLSHSSFGSSGHPQATKMQAAMQAVSSLDPSLECEGEMQGDSALSEEVRKAAFPNSRLKGEANLLIMPSVDAANISFNLLKVAAGGGMTLGPILLGVAKPVHILTPSASVRRIVNMTALTVVDCTIARAGAESRPARSEARSR